MEYSNKKKENGKHGAKQLIYKQENPSFSIIHWENVRNECKQIFEKK